VKSFFLRTLDLGIYYLGYLNNTVSGTGCDDNRAAARQSSTTRLTHLAP
jgi:hypothetical protein